jgi:hypothetical protein
MTAAGNTSSSRSTGTPHEPLFVSVARFTMAASSSMLVVSLLTDLRATTGPIAKRWVSLSSTDGRARPWTPSPTRKRSVFSFVVPLLSFRRLRPQGTATGRRQRTQSDARRRKPAVQPAIRPRRGGELLPARSRGDAARMPAPGDGGDGRRCDQPTRRLVALEKVRPPYGGPPPAPEATGVRACRVAGRQVPNAEGDDISATPQHTLPMVVRTAPTTNSPVPVH